MSKWKTYKRPHLKELPMEPGVYAIYHDKKLVYIGQSEVLRQRLIHHEKLSDLTPQLVTVKVRLCNRRSAEWLSLEFRLIRRLRPKLNRDSVRPPKLQGFKAVMPKEPRTEGNMPLKEVVSKVMDLYDQGFAFSYIASILAKEEIEDALGDWWTKESLARLVKDELKRQTFGSGRYDLNTRKKCSA